MRNINSFAGYQTCSIYRGNTLWIFSLGFAMGRDETETVICEVCGRLRGGFLETIRSALLMKSRRAAFDPDLWL